MQHLWDVYHLHFITLLSALAMGGLVGIERQWRKQLAGVRTNALVALGAASFTLFAAILPNPGVDSVARVAAQVVSGIGFLGAGVIMRDGMTVHGLTTAATLWCSAAVGILCGAGLIDMAIMATSLILLVNLGLRPISRAIDAKKHRYDDDKTEINIVSITCMPQSIKEVRKRLDAYMENSQMQWLSWAVSSSEDHNHSFITAKIRGLDDVDPSNRTLFATLDTIDGVVSVSIQ